METALRTADNTYIYIDERNKTFPNKCGHYYSEVSGLFISLTNETHRHNNMCRTILERGVILSSDVYANMYKRANP